MRIGDLYVRRPKQETCIFPLTVPVIDDQRCTLTAKEAATIQEELPRSTRIITE